MIKAKFSNSLEAKRKRMKNLPKFYGDCMLGALKSDAKRMIKYFHDGIKYEEFDLAELKPLTVMRKTVRNFTQPQTPLYAAGDNKKDRSYVNMLRIKKLNNGWKVYPSSAKHWESDLKLKDLFIVHEYGTTIIRKDGTVIKIPKRPAFYLAYRKIMEGKHTHSRETSTTIKKAVREYIETGKIISEVKSFIRENQIMGKEEND